MYERILVPTDGSTGSAHVALQALDLANQYGATVYALHVVDTNVRSLLTETGGRTEELKIRGERAVEMVEQMGENHNVNVVTKLREGPPAETILQFAEEMDVRLIVAGTHGRTGVKRHVVGSVAERLVRQARCPVMTVRLPETDVTVDETDHARRLVSEALDTVDSNASVSTIERQLQVWVAEAASDEHQYVVYLDPVTQRTTVLEQ